MTLGESTVVSEHIILYTWCKTPTTTTFTCKSLVQKSGFTCGKPTTGGIDDTTEEWHRVGYDTYTVFLDYAMASI